MEPPIPAPDEEAEAVIPTASFSLSYCGMAVLGVVLLGLLIRRTVFWCTPNSACDACQYAGAELIFAPVVLTLPFGRIIATSGLNPLGVVARSAVIGGVVLWGGAFVYLMAKSIML